MRDKRFALLVAAVLAAGLAGCGSETEKGPLAGTWKNGSGSLVFGDGTLTRRAGRISQRGSYTLHDVKDRMGRVVIVMDGQKLDCRFVVKGTALTLAEPCATNFDGGVWTRAA